MYHELDDVRERMSSRPSPLKSPTTSCIASGSVPVAGTPAPRVTFQSSTVPAAELDFVSMLQISEPNVVTATRSRSRFPSPSKSPSTSSVPSQGVPVSSSRDSSGSNVGRRPYPPQRFTLRLAGFRFSLKPSLARVAFQDDGNRRMAATFTRNGRDRRSAGLIAHTSLHASAGKEFRYGRSTGAHGRTAEHAPPKFAGAFALSSSEAARKNGGICSCCLSAHFARRPHDPAAVPAGSR